MISIDTEATGLDLRHGAKPFLVTITYRDRLEEPLYWVWDVDPLTREPIVDLDDLAEIQAVLDDEDEWVLQNPKFDYEALSVLYRSSGLALRWDWSKVKDTLLAGHLLASNAPHDLTTMGMVYCQTNIAPLEDRLRDACVQARQIARTEYPDWAIAKVGRADMPSVKDTAWKADMWLPRAIALAKGYPEDHPWWTVCPDYACGDSVLTVVLYLRQKYLIEERGLWPIYEQRLKVLPVVTKMEGVGVTVSLPNLEQISAEYRVEAARCEKVCTALSGGLLEELPGGVSNALKATIFDHFKLVSNKKTDKGNPSMDKDVLAHWMATLPETSAAYHFVKNLGAFRSRKTALSYMEGYQKFWKPVREGQNAVNQSGTVSRDKTPIQDRKDSDLLDMEGGKVRQRVRSIEGPGGVSRPSGQLSPVSGVDTSGPKSLPQVRQSGLYKPRSPISGDDAGKYEGYDSERPGRQSQGGETSRSETDRRGYSTNPPSTPGGDKANRTLPPVPDKRASDVLNNPSEILETRRIIPNWFRLHPSLNPTGTDTLRWSSSSPNEQNISKKEGFNIRYCFGPSPGREWWSCDAKNIELRLPAYEAGETGLIDLFEKPDDPPFYGSNHLLVFSILHPDLWQRGIDKVGFEKVGSYCKKQYASTWYQWTKNGNFAVQYGAMEESGTADRAYHVPGGQRIIESRFTNIARLNKSCIEFANEHGYIETMPDRTVDPTRGYPLLCSRTYGNRVKPTVPLNYRIQGTAMWWMTGAMIRVQEYLDRVNERDPRGFHMIMQVHDELVFDFPKGRTPEPWREHRGKIRAIQKLMEVGGEYLIPSIPTPVSCEYHPQNWSEGIAV